MKLNEEIAHKIGRKILNYIYLESIKGREIVKLDKIKQRFSLDEVSIEELYAGIEYLVSIDAIVYDRGNELLMLQEATHKKITKKKDVATIKRKLGTLLAALSTAIFAMIVASTFSDRGVPLIGDPLNPLKNVDSIVNEKITSKIWDYKNKLDQDSVSDGHKLSIQFDVRLINVNERLKGLEGNINNINSLLEDSPQKFVEIASVKKELDVLTSKLDYFVEANQSELDRMSNFNIGLIGLVGALLALNVWGGFRKTKEQN